MQEDALFATQTPREALTFSAALRLPVSVTEAERTQLVENIIQALGLSKCADTLIGSHMIPGISGGEKKRTAIGVELVSSPDILFLDEPVRANQAVHGLWIGFPHTSCIVRAQTSGLDSFAAFQVVQILKNLAASGRTVVTTIHQPSSEVFESFTDVLLLADGRLVYHSPVAEMTNYFASVGQRRAGDVDPKQFICRPNYNPADFVMFMMQQQTAEGIEVLAQEWAHEVKTAALEGGRGRACSGASLSMEASKSARERYESILNTNEKKPGFCTQFKYLATREVLGVLRDKGSMGARIGSTIFLNIIVAMVFFQAADWSDVDGSSQAEVITQVNAQFGVLVQLGIGGMFGLAQPTMLTFPLERPVFLREYASGSYGAVPYFLSKLMSEVPTTIMQSALMWLCTYWLCGLEGNFFVLVLTVALLGLVAASTSLLIGAIAESVQVAMQLTPLLFVPQLVCTRCRCGCVVVPTVCAVVLTSWLFPDAAIYDVPVSTLQWQLFGVLLVQCGTFSRTDANWYLCVFVAAGFFIPISQIPVWLRWAQYLCSLKCAFAIAWQHVVPRSHLPCIPSVCRLAEPSSHCRVRPLPCVLAFRVCRGRVPLFQRRLYVYCAFGQLPVASVVTCVPLVCGCDRRLLWCGPGRL